MKQSRNLFDLYFATLTTEPDTNATNSMFYKGR